MKNKSMKVRKPKKAYKDLYEMTLGEKEGYKDAYNKVLNKVASIRNLMAIAKDAGSKGISLKSLEEVFNGRKFKLCDRCRREGKSVLAVMGTNNENLCQPCYENHEKAMASFMASTVKRQS